MKTFEKDVHIKFEFLPDAKCNNDLYIRGIKFGSITRYLTTTGEMAEFLQSQTKPALLNACRAHKEKCHVALQPNRICSRDCTSDSIRRACSESDRRGA